MDTTGAAVDGGTTSQVHAELRRQILHGDLQGGEVISQLELSKRLNVSRTPLREAVRLLEREGLVVNSGLHKLVKISSLSMQELDDLYSLRVLGEALAIQLSVPVLRDDDLARLRADLTTTDEDVHRRFHAGLRVGANTRLRDHLELLFEHAERYQRVYMQSQDSEQKLAEHHAILDACEDRDAKRARDLLVDHLAVTAISLMTTERHAPFALPTAVAMAKGS